MGPVLHQSDILGGGVNTLTILYRPLEHVGELSFVTQEIRADEVYHAPILDKIILQRITSQNNAPFCTDLLQSLKDIREDEEKMFIFWFVLILPGKWMRASSLFCDLRHK